MKTKESESMSTFGWDQMTDWWDKQLGDEGDLWHRALIDPPLLQLVGEVSGLHLLDLACGNGYLSRRFARQGAIVTSVDANAPLIERDRKSTRLNSSHTVISYAVFCLKKKKENDLHHEAADRNSTESMVQ